VIFAPKYVFRVVFEGGFLGGAHNFWGNPYLNSTTVLFDNDVSEFSTVQLHCHHCRMIITDCINLIGM